MAARHIRFESHSGETNGEQEQIDEGGSENRNRDGTAHKFVAAGAMAKEELEEISKQVEGLKRQLQKTTKRLQRALR